MRDSLHLLLGRLHTKTAAPVSPRAWEACCPRTTRTVILVAMLGSQYAATSCAAKMRSGLCLRWWAGARGEVSIVWRAGGAGGAGGQEGQEGWEELHPVRQWAPVVTWEPVQLGQQGARRGQPHPPTKGARAHRTPSLPAHPWRWPPVAPIHPHLKSATDTKPARQRRFSRSRAMSRSSRSSMS